MNNSLRELRQHQIVAGARSIVSSGGLEALTISKLEDQLEFSRGVITYHFKNKDEIVNAVLESALDEILSGASTEAQKGTTVPEKIHAILDAMIHGFIERTEAAHILISFWSRLPKDEEVRSRNAKLYAGYRDQVARVLGKARKNGEISASKSEISSIAALVVGIVIGTAMQFYFQPGAIEPRSVIKESAQAISMRLGFT